ncbi:MAG: hypothetical protein M1426_04025, partial [Patescibacteria group bacterium]|nr:hypothetical protein [Patescibacteria group bacterium]
MNTTKNKYDVIEIDMFHGGMYMPFHIATVEFFRTVREHLNYNGVMVINVLSFNDIKGGDELYYYLGNTMAKVFNALFAIKQKQYNITVVAAKDTISLDDVREHIRQHPMINHEGIGEILHYALDNIFVYEYNDSYGFFTDDRAPVEQVTYNML